MPDSPHGQRPLLCQFCHQREATCVGTSIPGCDVCCAHGGGNVPGPCIPIGLLSPWGRAALLAWYEPLTANRPGALVALHKEEGAHG